MDGSQNKSSGEIHIEGDISGQIAIGNQINQTQSTQHIHMQISEADLQELHNLIEDLKQQIAATASPELKDKALERTSELEDAITAEKANLNTMEYVRDWFGRNLPKLAGAVSALVVHPIVGKIVEVSGEAVALEFKRRFGIP
jgi:hypothetical protein